MTVTPSPQSVVVPVSAIVGFDVEEYVGGYEFRGDEGGYMPTDKERELITDAIHGVMSELSCLSAPAPSSLAGGEVESRALDWMEWVAQGALDTDDIQLSGAEIIQHAEIELASIRKQAALSPEAPAREAKAFAMKDGMTTHPTLRSANIARQDEWDQDGQITASYRGNELAGEVGEACNVIKKLERERLGILGSRATVGELADELADVLICADLIAMHYGIDLEAAVVRKFNATSEKVGLQTRLAAPNDGGGS